MEHLFDTAPHSDILAVLLQVTVLLLVARTLGEIAQRMGQPTIVGEILAGIVLGPSLISGLVPVAGEWLVPQTTTQVHLLDVFSMLGSMFMMLIAGMEIDILLIRRQATSAIGTGVGGLVVPFVLGFVMAQFLPDRVLPDPDQRLGFSLFVATAISASAIPVIAKVLMDLDLIRRDFSQVIISAAMIEDAAVWIILSVVVGIAEGSGVTPGGVLLSIGGVLGFVVVSLTLGRWVVRRSLSFVQNELTVRDMILSLVIVLMFAWAVFSLVLHLEPVIGAFVVGILFGQMRTLPHSVIHRLESIALGIFAPIFFAVAGLKVNLLSIVLDPTLLGIALLVIVVSSVAKIAGAYLGARMVARSGHWTALSFGVGLNVHGAVEIIIATIGLSKGILTQEMFSIIVLLSIVTSLAAPTLLRWVLSHVQTSPQEMERLKREALLKDNLFANVHRVLLPVRRREDDQGGPLQTVESRILEHVGAKTKISLTLLNVAVDNNRSGSHAFLDKLSRRFFYNFDVTKKVISKKDPLDVILDEAQKGYDVIFMGATRNNDRTEVLFNPLVDSMVRMSPCPSVVVHGEHVPADWEPQRILVPTNGSLASRRAVQAAFSLASDGDGEVLILKVVRPEATMCNIETRESILERQYIIAHQIVDELGEIGHSLGVQTYTAVQPGDEPEHVIIEVAEHAHIDLIILGTNVRAGSERLYLGARVEYILRNAPCPVIVVNSAF
jgi:Kef-type K+ transport system membrane component KefB